MLDAADLTAFVATTNSEKARAFYETTLGLRLVSDDGFAVVFDSNGTTLRVTKVREHTPAPFTVLGWQVTDIRAALADLATRGVAAERFPGVPQDPAGVWTAPDGTQVAWFKDPDGNILSVTQH